MMRMTMKDSKTNLDFVLCVHSASEEFARLKSEAHFFFETFDFGLA